VVFKTIKRGHENIWEIKCFDADGRKIEEWKVMNGDFPQAVSILSKKYGFNIYIKKQKEDRDFDWAM